MFEYGQSKAEEQKATSLRKAARIQQEKDAAQKEKAEQKARLRALRLAKEAAEQKA